MNLMSKKRPETAVTQFKVSLNELIKILSSKEPSYIRCIKPNDFKTPSELFSSIGTWTLWALNKYEPYS